MYILWVDLTFTEEERQFVNEHQIRNLNFLLFDDLQKLHIHSNLPTVVGNFILIYSDGREIKWYDM